MGVSKAFTGTDTEWWELVAQNKDREITKLKKELAEYESVSIGIDVGFKDATAIMIAHPDENGTYILHSKTYQPGDEEYIKLKDLIELKHKEQALRGK